MSTLRPLNKCDKCGYTWYPRGKDRSLQCPNCKSGSVIVVQQLGCCGIIGVGILLCTVVGFVGGAVQVVIGIITAVYEGVTAFITENPFLSALIVVFVVLAIWLTVHVKKKREESDRRFLEIVQQMDEQRDQQPPMKDGL